MRYTDEQKALALSMLERHGGLSNAGVQAARDLLESPGLSKSTLNKWRRLHAQALLVKPGNKDAAPAPAQALARTDAHKVAIEAAQRQRQADAELDNMFMEIARRYAEHATDPDTVAATKGKDAVTAAAIAIDKVLLLRRVSGVPAEILAILPDVLAAIETMGQQPVEFFRRIVSRAIEYRVAADSAADGATGEA